MFRHSFRLAGALIALLVLCAPAAAGAKPSDRDRDRLPDRWERKHRITRPGGDQDRDRLTNLAEYRAKTNPRRRDTDRDRLMDGRERKFGFNPRDRDTDDDGITDGAENAGVINAVTGPVVTIWLAVGGVAIALVTPDTDLGCPLLGALEDADESAESVEEPLSALEPELGTAHGEGEEPTDEALDSVRGDDMAAIGPCAEALEVGAVVHQAELSGGPLGLVYTVIDVLKK